MTEQFRHGHMRQALALVRRRKGSLQRRLREVSARIPQDVYAALQKDMTAIERHAEALEQLIAMQEEAMPHEAPKDDTRTTEDAGMDAGGDTSSD